VETVETGSYFPCVHLVTQRQATLRIIGRALFADGPRWEGFSRSPGIAGQLAARLNAYDRHHTMGSYATRGPPIGFGVPLNLSILVV
jgi:hypothetical protein